MLVGIGLVALRRSSYGRRLTAMKDSPAAAATLGQNLVKLKLSVFMLSAAIAGLGGILLSAAFGSVNATTYIIFVSLALVMLTVVGGIGSVAGALMGGILAGTAFTALTSTFTEPQHRPRRRGLLERHGQPLAGGPGAHRRQPRPQPERSRAADRGELPPAVAGEGRAGARGAGRGRAPTCSS